MRFDLSFLSLSLSLLTSLSEAFYQHVSLDEPFQNSLRKLPHSACVTLYYRNGRSGCGSTDRDVQAGPLFYYDGSSSPPSGSSFVAVIEEYDLTAETVSNLLGSSNSGHLKGILVLNSTYVNDENEVSSTGPMYPLGYSTPNADVSYGNTQFAWNAFGDGLNQYDLYGTPMAYVYGYETSGYIRQSAQKDNNEAVDIYSEFNYYMGPDGVHSEECLAWKDAHDGSWAPKCLPLGGTSVWSFAGSPPQGSYFNNNASRKLEDGAAADEGDDAAAAEEEAAAADESEYNIAGDGKAAIVLAASMDSTSMFHDLATGANEGATNVLTVLLAAYLLGSSVSDSTLDALNNRIVFALFEGEAYGFLGSRRFLNDVMNFSCDAQYTVNSVSKDGTSDLACLYPMRPSLKFKDIGQIAGMLTVDQVGLPASSGNLFVHNDGNGGMGTFMANVLKYSGTGTSYFTAVDSAAGSSNNGGDFPYPPTPLTSLQSLTGGDYGGAVLTGYDYAFNKKPPYQSHLNWIYNSDMNHKAIASAATMLARTALAAAYDDGSYDYATAAKYAYNTIGALDYQDEMLVTLANCLHVNGNCQMFNKYANMEAKNERARTGMDGLSSGEALGMPPNYYVGVYSADYGQPFVRVGNAYYGAYDGDKYGKSSTDAIAMQPKLLPQAMRGILNDFLGKGSSQTSDGSSSYTPRTCNKEADCNGIKYCGKSGDSATCTGGKVCVCKRAFYHIALDEAVEPATNNATGYFETPFDEGVTPMWTEPYWSNEVGIRMYRVSEKSPGLVSLAAGGICLGVCFVLAVMVKMGMRKEKVY
jgi:nicastrin